MTFTRPLPPVSSGLSPFTWFNVKSSPYNAAGNGTADDTGPIQTAGTAAANANGTLYFPTSTYRSATSAGGAITFTKPVTMQGDGAGQAILLMDDVNNSGVSFDPGGFDITLSISADFNQDTRQATVTSSAALSALPNGGVGVACFIEDQWQIAGVGQDCPYQQKFITYVRSVDDATHVTFEEPMPTTYHTAKTATIQARTNGFISNVTVQNLTFINATSPARPANRHNLLVLTRCIEPYVTGCIFDGTMGSAVYYNYCRGIGMFENRWSHIYDATGSNATTGIALTIERSTDMRISDNRMRRVGQGMAVQFGSCYGVISNNILFGCWTQAGFPLPAQPTDQGGRGIKCIGGSDIELTGNNAFDFGYEGLRLSGCRRCNIVGGVLEHFPDTGTGNGLGIGMDAGGTGGDEGGRNDHNSAEDVKIYDCQGYGCYTLGGTGFNVFRNLTISKTNQATAQGAIYSTSPDLTVIGCVIDTVTQDAIYMDTGSDRFMIQGCKISAFSGAVGIDIYVTDGSIVGTYINNTVVSALLIRCNTGSQRTLIAANTFRSSVAATGVRTTGGNGNNKIVANIDLSSLSYDFSTTDKLDGWSRDGQTSFSGGGATQTPNLALANYYLYSITNATAWTMNAPTNPTTGKRFLIRIKNASGGALGAITYPGTFHFAGGAKPAEPANGQSYDVEMMYDVTDAIYVEISRSITITN